MNEPPSKRDLRRMYVTEQLGSGDIAKRVGIPRSSVQHWLRVYGIPQRTKSESAKLREKKPETIEVRRKQLLESQAKITPEGRRRQAIAISGPRKPWTDEVRAKHAYRSTPEYRKKLSDAQKGDKAHNWQGGVTPELVAQLNTYQWRLRRQECYERDDWTCQECGEKCLNARVAKQQGRHHLRIQAHHIVPRRKDGSDELENLVTLCLADHRRIEHLNK